MEFNFGEMMGSPASNATGMDEDFSVDEMTRLLLPAVPNQQSDEHVEVDDILDLIKSEESAEIPPDADSIVKDNQVSKVHTKQTSDEKITTETDYRKSAKQEDGSIATEEFFYEKTTCEQLDGSCTCIKETTWDKLTTETKCCKAIHLKLRVKTAIENEYEKCDRETCEEKYITEIGGSVVQTNTIQHDPTYTRMIKDQTNQISTIQASDDMISIFDLNSKKLNSNVNYMLDNGPHYSLKPKVKGCKSLGFARKSPTQKRLTSRFSSDNLFSGQSKGSNAFSQINGNLDFGT